MADRNRRSDDGERDDAAFDDAVADDEAYDDAYDGDPDEADDDQGGEDERPARRRTPARSVAARSRPVARPRGRDETGRGLFGRIGDFVREVVAELQKVIWPTRKELITYTVVVIVFVTIVMTFVALLDVGFAKLMFQVFGTSTSE